MLQRLQRRVDFREVYRLTWWEMRKITEIKTRLSNVSGLLYRPSLMSKTLVYLNLKLEPRLWSIDPIEPVQDFRDRDKEVEILLTFLRGRMNRKYSWLLLYLYSISCIIYKLFNMTDNNSCLCRPSSKDVEYSLKRQIDLSDRSRSRVTEGTEVVGDGF